MADLDIVIRLRMPWEGMGEMANAERAEAADKIEMLRAQRDAARREVCGFMTDMCGGCATQWAKSRCWDCFKEEA